MTSPETADVRAIAALARIALDDAEVERFGADLTRILAAFRSISAADLGSTPPAGSAPALPSPRADEPRPSLSRDALLARAPESEDGFYRVPKTVGGER
jgi:aspartyl-tRNA(Asn)/glutamyl-tRNA(Gln) amidotransferase subunit C